MIKLLLSCYEVIILFVFFYVNMLYGFIMASEEIEDVLTFIKRR